MIAQYLQVEEFKNPIRKAKTFFAIAFNAKAIQQVKHHNPLITLLLRYTKCFNNPHLHKIVKKISTFQAKQNVGYQPLINTTSILFSTEPLFISDLRFQTRCLIFAAHWNFFLALNVCSSFNDCPSHLIDSTQFHASLKLYCDWFTPYYVIVHVIVVCLPHLFCEFQIQFYVWFYGGRTCF